MSLSKNLKTSLCKYLCLVCDNMVSTIDKIRDTTLWRTIRKLAGVVDEQNTVVESVQNKLDSFNLDGVNSDIANLKASDATQNQKIEQLRISDDENTEQNATNARNISNLNTEVTEIKKIDLKQTEDINGLNTMVDALTKELPTAITLYKSGTGKIQAVVEQEDSTTLDSNVLDMIIPYQYDLIPGSTNRSFKLKIVFSDGSQALTNDFLIPEGGGTDVTVTGITLTKDPTDPNRFKASINLSDGTPIESGFLEMVTSVSGTFANNQLKIKVNGVESIPISIDTGVVYSQGQGIIISDGEIKIDSSVVALKADLSIYATKSVQDQIQTTVGTCFNDVALGADGKSLDFTKVGGQTNKVEIPSSPKEVYEFSWDKDTNTGPAISDVLNVINSLDRSKTYRFIFNNMESVQGDFINGIFYTLPPNIWSSSDGFDAYGYAFKVSNNKLLVGFIYSMHPRTDRIDLSGVVEYNEAITSFDINWCKFSNVYSRLKIMEC